MMELSRLLVSTLAILGGAATALSPSDKRLRADFVRAMDEALQEKQSLDELHRRLYKVAKPVTPEVKRMLQDGDDDGYGLDLKEFALKYVGCQNIHTFSDELAEEENAQSVLMMNRFVVLRLCPRNTCSAYNDMGCNYNYGEYLLPMEDYLGLMAQYHYGRFQKYCNICAACMNGDEYDVNAQDYNYYYYTDDSTDDYYGDDYYANGDDNQNNNNNNGNDDYFNDDYFGRKKRNRRLNDNYYAGDDANAGTASPTDGGTQGVYCEYENVCFNYMDACKYFSDAAVDYEQFFECSEFQVGNGVGYLGPHCRSDGKTIGIGIYGDENCHEYIGDLVDIDSYTGMRFNDGALQPYYSRTCISCMDSESYDLYTDDAVGDSVYEVCDVLYDASAKCNRHLDDMNTFNEDEENQETEEGRVCNYIASVVENNYDESGEIVLTGSNFDFSRWADVEQYKNYISSRASPLQALGLAASLLLCIFLMIYSCYLHRKLQYRKQWATDQIAPSFDAGKISRMQSGITMMRSSSGSWRGGAAYA